MKTICTFLQSIYLCAFSNYEHRWRNDFRLVGASFRGSPSSLQNLFKDDSVKYLFPEINNTPQFCWDFNGCICTHRFFFFACKKGFALAVPQLRVYQRRYNILCYSSQILVGNTYSIADIIFQETEHSEL